MTRPLTVMGAAFLLLVSCAVDTTEESRTGERPRPVFVVSDSPSPSPTPSPTESPPPVPFHFVAIGDWGTGWEPQYDLARRMCKMRRNQPFDLVVTAGDNIYETGHPDDFRAKFFRPFRCLLSNGVQFRSTLGNHDTQTRNGRPELNEARFGMPRRNYVLRQEGVRFVMADSNDLDRDWLRRATRMQAGDHRTIVVFHHPVYSSSSHHPSGSDRRESLTRLFARRGVDVVINGHTHLYAVTKPLRGIRYVTTGGGSASPHPCTPRRFTARCIVAYHFLSIEVGLHRIRVRAISPGAGVIHRFQTDGRMP